MGMQLSPQIEEKIPKVIHMIKEEVEASLGRKLDITERKEKCEYSIDSMSS